VNQKLIQKDWQRIAEQELKNNYIYCALISLLSQIKGELIEIEREVIGILTISDLEKYRILWF
jgi:hypothetical protein